MWHQLGFVTVTSTRIHYCDVDYWIFYCGNVLIYSVRLCSIGSLSASIFFASHSFSPRSVSLRSISPLHQRGRGVIGPFSSSVFIIYPAVVLWRCLNVRKRDTRHFPDVNLIVWPFYMFRRLEIELYLKKLHQKRNLFHHKVRKPDQHHFCLVSVLITMAS